MKLKSPSTIAATVFAAFVCGALVDHFTFTHTTDATSVVGTYGHTSLQIDSLILQWCDEKAVGFFEAAGLQRVGPPPIPGARVGFFPDEVRSLSDSIQQAYGIPSPIILAQFALESRFGTSDLNAFNFFGHKFAVAEKYGPKPAQRTMALTREFVDGSWVTLKVPFARYKSTRECFVTHGKFLSTAPLYRQAMKFKSDPTRYAEELGKHYASDPDYSLKLTTIIRRYQLNRQG